MRKKLTVVLALLFSIAAHAQTREVTEDGTYVFEASGRYVRFEGTDGVVVEFLYAPGTDEPVGWRVRVNDKLAFTMNQTADSHSISIAGLPKLESIFDDQGRTSSVLADGKSIAQFEYTPNGYFAAVTLPGHFRWKTSTPSASHQVRQTVEDARGRLVGTTDVTTDMTKEGVRDGEVYDVVADELGLTPDELKFEYSPTGHLTTVRDAQGRVAFYVTEGTFCAVGYSADGKPLFYDFSLYVLGGEIASKSDLDLLMSKAQEGQRGTLPDHLMLTARGGIALYAHESANHALRTVWMTAEGMLNAEDVSVSK